jgi:ABC-type Fe3+-hydroxamate transport system substrate-binding protein
MSQLRAVSEHRVKVLTGDVMVIPGPRVARVVEAMAAAIHPDLAKDGTR